MELWKALKIKLYYKKEKKERKSVSKDTTYNAAK